MRTNYFSLLTSLSRCAKNCNERPITPVVHVRTSTPASTSVDKGISQLSHARRVRRHRIRYHNQILQARKQLLTIKFLQLHEETQTIKHALGLVTPAYAQQTNTNSVGRLSFVLFVKTKDANQQDSAPAHVTCVCVLV